MRCSHPRHKLMLYNASQYVGTYFIFNAFLYVFVGFSLNDDLYKLQPFYKSTEKELTNNSCYDINFI